MKLIYIFTFFSVALYGQNDSKGNLVKITYEHFSTALSEDINLVYLYANDTISQFVNLRKEQVIEPVPNMKMTQPFFKYINNFNFITGLVEENRILKDSTRLYAKWKNEMEWEITDEEKTIGGYTVRKAFLELDPFETGGEQYDFGKVIAWFTTEIPIPSGPGRYYGLPGLVIELGYENAYEKYKLKKIEFQNNTYQLVELNRENVLEDKFDLILFTHKNPKLIRDIQKKTKK